MLALFCGKEETDTEAVPAQQVTTSPRNSLSVLFSSDFSNEERYSGFMAHYSAMGEDQRTAVTTGFTTRLDLVLQPGENCGYHRVRTSF